MLSIWLVLIKKKKKKRKHTKKPTNADQSSRIQLAARWTLTVERTKIVSAGAIDTRAAFTFIYIYNPEGRDAVRTAVSGKYYVVEMLLWTMIYQHACLTWFIFPSPPPTPFFFCFYRMWGTAHVRDGHMHVYVHIFKVLIKWLFPIKTKDFHELGLKGFPESIMIVLREIRILFLWKTTHSQPQCTVHKHRFYCFCHLWLHEALEELRKPSQKQNITMLARVP